MGACAVSYQWSDSLKAQTREVVENRGVLASRDGYLHLKHIISGFGVMLEDDILRGILRVVDARTGAETTFVNADELIAAGWALD